MVELITEILIYLGLAALIGLVMGYLIWGWGSAARTSSARADGVAAALASTEREARLRERLVACEQENAQLTQEVARLTGALQQDGPETATPDVAVHASEDAPDAAPVAPRGLLDTRPEAVDDLKQIKGVGAVMEGVLNDKGIYLYRQLANLSEREADWVNEAIEAFPGRIHRDRWIQQAKQLHREKYPDSNAESEAADLS